TPGVRKQAIILSERYPELLPDVCKMINDTSVQVDFQATLSIGNFSSPLVVSSLSDVMVKHADDPLFRKAVLSSEAGSSVQLLQKLVTRNSTFIIDTSKGTRSFLKDFFYITGARKNKEDIAAVMKILFASDLKKQTNVQHIAL